MTSKLLVLFTATLLSFNLNAASCGCPPDGTRLDGAYNDFAVMYEVTTDCRTLDNSKGKGVTEGSKEFKLLKVINCENYSRYLVKPWSPSKQKWMKPIMLDSSLIVQYVVPKKCECPSGRTYFDGVVYDFALIQRITVHCKYVDNDYIPPDSGWNKGDKKFKQLGTLSCKHGIFHVIRPWSASKQRWMEPIMVDDSNVVLYSKK